jgi:hypothetical protein
VRRRGNRPGVRRADLAAYLARARIQPGEITGGRNPKVRHEAREPNARLLDGDVPGLTETTVLRDEFAWTDGDIARVFGIHYFNVYRRRINGFGPEQVDQFRRLRREVEGGRDFYEAG